MDDAAKLKDAVTTVQAHLKAEADRFKGVQVEVVETEIMFNDPYVFVPLKLVSIATGINPMRYYGLVHAVEERLSNLESDIVVFTHGDLI